jgi:hypothetical protein
LMQDGSVQLSVHGDPWWTYLSESCLINSDCPFTAAMAAAVLVT